MKGRINRPEPRQWTYGESVEPTPPRRHVLRVGSLVTCSYCGKQHQIDTQGADGSLWYSCGEQLGLAGGA